MSSYFITRSDGIGRDSSVCGIGGQGTSLLEELLVFPELLRWAVRGGGASGLATDDCWQAGSGILIRDTCRGGTTASSWLKVW